jgi:hypothetical protein
MERSVEYNCTSYTERPQGKLIMLGRTLSS